MQDIISNHFFEYDLDRGIVVFSEDTNDVGQFVDDINIFGTKLKDYKTNFFTVTVKNVKFIEDATRILVLEVLYDLTICSKNVVVNWYYDTHNVLEIGEEFSELLDEVEFRFYELAKSS
jgi:hypothetical protein